MTLNYMPGEQTYGNLTLEAHRRKCLMLAKEDRSDPTKPTPAAFMPFAPSECLACSSLPHLEVRRRRRRKHACGVGHPNYSETRHHIHRHRKRHTHKDIHKHTYTHTHLLLPCHTVYSNTCMIVLF
jgi:hypothetical protein